MAKLKRDFTDPFAVNTPPARPPVQGDDPQAAPPASSGSDAGDVSRETSRDDPRDSPQEYPQADEWGGPEGIAGAATQDDVGILSGNRPRVTHADLAILPREPIHEADSRVIQIDISPADPSESSTVVPRDNPKVPHSVTPKVRLVGQPGDDPSGDLDDVSRDTPRSANAKAREMAAVEPWGPKPEGPVPRVVRNRRRRQQVAQLSIECSAAQKAAILAAAERAGLTLKDWVLDRLLGEGEQEF